MKALSIRQPWAWAIIYAGKDIENRSENMAKRLQSAMGQRIYIHAGKTLDGDALPVFEKFALVPKLERFLKTANMDQLTGGVIGTVKIVDVVANRRSKWFTGPWGIVLTDPEPLRFQPGRGQLGLFEWRPGNPNPC